MKVRVPRLRTFGRRYAIRAAGKSRKSQCAFLQSLPSTVNCLNHWAEKVDLPDVMAWIIISLLRTKAPDTIAADMENQPFRDNGSFCSVPAGMVR